MIPTSAQRTPHLSASHTRLADSHLVTDIAAAMVVAELEAVLAAEVTPPPIRRRVLSSPALFWLPTLTVLAAFWAGVVWAGPAWAVVS